MLFLLGYVFIILPALCTFQVPPGLYSGSRLGATLKAKFSKDTVTIEVRIFGAGVILDAKNVKYTATPIPVSADYKFSGHYDITLDEAAMNEALKVTNKSYLVSAAGGLKYPGIAVKFYPQGKDGTKESPVVHVSVTAGANGRGAKILNVHAELQDPATEEEQDRPALLSPSSVENAHFAPSRNFAQSVSSSGAHSVSPTAVTVNVGNGVVLEIKISLEIKTVSPSGGGVAGTQVVVTPTVQVVGGSTSA